MLFFFNLFAGTQATLYLIDNSRGLALIFPLINIVNISIIIFLFQSNAINIKSISDENTRYHEIAIGTALTILVIFVSEFIYKTYWALTISICTSIIPALNRAFDNILLNIKTIKGVTI